MMRAVDQQAVAARAVLQPARDARHGGGAQAGLLDDGRIGRLFCQQLRGFPAPGKFVDFVFGQQITQEFFHFCLVSNACQSAG